MSEYEGWLRFAREDIRMADLAMQEGCITRSVLIRNNVLKKH
jgi:hypothetical protein